MSAAASPADMSGTPLRHPLPAGPAVVGMSFSIPLFPRPFSAAPSRV
ncbi:hypothetical protein [Arthrobacter sp. MAHUQ-56]